MFQADADSFFASGVEFSSEKGGMALRADLDFGDEVAASARNFVLALGILGFASLSQTTVNDELAGSTGMYEAPIWPRASRSAPPAEADLLGDLFAEAALERAWTSAITFMGEKGQQSEEVLSRAGRAFGQPRTNGDLIDEV